MFLTMAFVLYDEDDCQYCLLQRLEEIRKEQITLVDPSKPLIDNKSPVRRTKCSQSIMPGLCMKSDHFILPKKITTTCPDLWIYLLFHAQEREAWKIRSTNTNTVALFFDIWDMGMELEYDVNKAFLQDLHYYFLELERKQKPH